MTSTSQTLAPTLPPPFLAMFITGTRPDEDFQIYEETGRAIFKTLMGIRAFLKHPRGGKKELSDEIQKAPPVPRKAMYLFLAMAMNQDEGKLDLAVKTLTYLFPVADINLNCWIDLQTHYHRVKLTMEANAALGSTTNRFFLEELVGRKFVERWTLDNVQTLGHTNDRLENLGDCALEIVMSVILHRRFSEAKPKKVVILTSASVSNDTLGAWAVSVGLHNGVQWHNQRQARKVAASAVALNARFANRGKGKKQFRRYWSGVAIAKELGNLVESLLGAILVDSGFDLAVVFQVICRTLLPFVLEHVVPDPTTYM